MKIVTYLVFNRRRVLRATTKLPELKNGEYAVRLRVEAPDDLFKPDVPTVDISVPPRNVIVPEIVDYPGHPEDGANG